MVIRPLRWELEGFFEKICANNRVVFNVAVNKYRLVVEVQYRAGIFWVKFVGTHARYDQINVEFVNEYQAHPK